MNILVDGQIMETPDINRGIGVYFKNVFNNMVKQSYEHNWYLTLSNPDFIKCLDPWVAKRVRVILSPDFSPCSDFERTNQFTKRLNSTIQEYKIDLLWIPNPMMVNVLFPNDKLSCPVFATMFDLIPAVMPVKEWSKVIKAEYDRRLVYIKDEKVGLICISEATRRDFIKYAGEVPVMEVTFLAADSRLFYRKREKGGLSSVPNIVFTGGFDYRKNIEGALKTLKKAKGKNKGTLLDDIKLYIICKCDNKTREKFEADLKKMGLDKNVVLTGFLSDEELAEYYANADVFFFPSLYEGFGLPILEAMLGGAYILSADNSSLPEVCGEHGLMCDVADTDAMADKLFMALKNAGQETAMDKNIRQNYALNFNWEDTAEKTLALFMRESEIKAETNQRKKIAMVSPWPNQCTGIANYLYKLMPSIGRYFDIDIFVDKGCEKGSELLKNEYGALYDLKMLDKYNSQYFQIIYHIGNNDLYHTKIYEYMLKYPGIAEIHDFVLRHLFYYGYYKNGKEKQFINALEQGYGKAGREYFENIREKTVLKDSDMDIAGFPMSHTVLQNSKAVIFHNCWSKDQMQNADNVFVVPLASYDKFETDLELKKKIRQEFINRFDIQGDDVVIGCFGFINENKRPDKILSVIENLIKRDFKVKLVFFGKANYTELMEIISRKKLENKVYITGYIDYDQYAVGLEMCDIVVNLRYPSMGEASATLCEAFKYGKPVLVSDVNQYTEYPDEVCWKVPVGKDEVSILEKMLEYLILNEDVRKALGNNAKAYADMVLSPERIARLYYNVINTVADME